MLQCNNKLVCAMGYEFEAGMVQVWDMISGEDKFLIQRAHEKEIRAVVEVYGSAGKQFVTGGADAEVKIWDSNNYQIVQVIKLPGGVNDQVTSMITY